MTDPTEQTALLKSTMEALEAQRSILGDLVVDTSIKGLRQQLAELEAEGIPPLQQPAPADSMEGERKFVTIMLTGTYDMGEQSSSSSCVP